MRQNKKAAISHIAAQKYDKTTVNFLIELLNCSKDGIVYNFILNYQNEIINRIFGGERNKFFESYLMLVKDKFLASKGADLHILPWSDHILFAMKYNLQQKDKRVYRKDAAKDQIDFSEYAQASLGAERKYAAETGAAKEVKWNINWDKIKGIRLPRTFKDLLSGQAESFTYTKEKIRYLLGLITLADSDGVIQGFNVQYAHDRLSEIFEENTIALSTCYDVHKKLLADEIISVYDTPSGYKNLRIQGYKDGFKKGYIAVSYFVFQEVFKKLETAAVKIFFDVAFKHNNGENGKGKTDDNKPVIFKVATNSADNKDTISRHARVLGRLKKRSRSEILKLFSGASGRPGLNSIFNIDLHAIRKGLLYIRMKKEYMIQKSEAVKASFFSAADRFAKKAAVIKNILENTLIRLNDKQFDCIVEMLIKTSTRAIKAIINIINKELQEGNIINDMTAYIKAVYERYIAGERTKLSLDDINNDIIDKLSDPFEYLAEHGARA